MQQSIIGLITVFAAFSALFILVPFIVMGFKLQLKDMLYNIFSSLTVGAFFIILIVYFLAGINALDFWRFGSLKQVNLLSAPGIIVCGILLIAGTLWFVYRERTRNRINNTIEFFYLSLKGVYKFRIQFKSAMKSILMKPVIFIKDLALRPFSMICFLLGTAGAVYTRGYHCLTESFFGLSDVYVQTDWTAQTIGGNIFASGVYPFGMHSMAASISLLFNINLLVVMRFLGCVQGLFIVWSLYMLLRRMFKSKAAIGIGFMIYTILPTIESGAYFRQAHALPQETAMIFLFPAGVFFHEYIKTKKLKNLAFFAMAFALMIACHFYVAIIAIPMILVIFVVNFRQIIIKKLFLKLVIAGLLSVLFSVGPLVTAYAFGDKGWEGSIYWALSFLNLGKDAEEEEPPPDEDTSQGEEAEEVEEEKPLSWEVITTAFGKPSVFLFYTFSAGLGIVFAGILLIIRKHQHYARLLMAMALYAMGLVALGLMPKFGLPTLVEKSRIDIFFNYNIGFLFVIALDIVMFPFATIKKLRFVTFVLNFALGASFLWYFVKPMNIQNPGFVLQAQYNSAVECYYKIATNFERYKWTIISPVDELGVIRNVGWHYELCDLIYELAYGKQAAEGKPTNIKPELTPGKIIIPSDDLFFFIEKRPLNVWRPRWPMLYAEPDPENPDKFQWPVPAKGFEPQERITIENAEQDILEMQEKLGARLDAIYVEPDSRKTVMAKAYYWMQEYKKYFPNEVSVFYEDDDLIVYRLKQADPYSLNNLYIDYGYN